MINLTTSHKWNCLRRNKPINKTKKCKHILIALLHYNAKHSFTNEMFKHKVKEISQCCVFEKQTSKLAKTANRLQKNSKNTAKIQQKNTKKSNFPTRQINSDSLWLRIADRPLWRKFLLEFEILD